MRLLTRLSAAAPRIIQRIPENKVRNTDSNKIKFRTSAGVAPRARRTPSSLVRSLTEISKIFPIPITHARIVAAPIISDKKVSQFANPRMRPNISPRLKDPKARSSVGSTL